MKRKIVKFFNGKKPISIWRVTFVLKCVRPEFATADCFLTYFCFASSLPDALIKLYKFVPRSKWDFYKFERFQELDYNLIYEL